MGVLILGLFLFMGIHILPSLSLREKLIDKWGLKAYKLSFSLVSALGLVLIVYGKLKAPFIAVYTPAAWGMHLPFIVMLPVSILMVLAHTPSRLKLVLRHPMLLGVSLWATVHLCANGDLASLLLFGSFLIFSILDMLSLEWREKVAKTKGKWHWDILSVVLGGFTYLLALKIHGF